jgi:hypothetical protein
MYRMNFRRCGPRQTLGQLYSRFSLVLLVLEIQVLVYRYGVMFLFSLGMRDTSWRPLYEPAVAKTLGIDPPRSSG